jgi:capsule polysaccharide export protein KpsE/RkpR
LDTQEKEYKDIDQGKTAEESTAADSASQQPSRAAVQDDEIDLVALARQFWDERKIVLITVPIFFLLGLFVAVVSPEEYTAEITLMPQSGGSGSSSINSGLLQQFGLGSLGGGSASSGGNLSVSLYPDITHSTPFMSQLVKEEFYFATLDTTVTLLTYFSEIKPEPFTQTLKQYTLGVPKMLINLPLSIANSFKSEKPGAAQRPPTLEDTTEEVVETEVADFSPVVISSQEYRVMTELKDRIITSIEANGTLKVSAKMPDPVVAAKVTEMAVVFLTEYVKDYKVEKAREDLAFIEQQFEEKEKRYNQAQNRLARLRDRNMNIVSESARIELERAQTEFNLAFSLYQSIAQQLEQAKIKLQEEMPLFKVLEPVQVPLGKSEPNQELIVILFTFGGLFLGIGIIFFKVIYQQIKQNFS